ncbi:type II toxin-antitoxin system prevent-host-death family antitoxin [soil metagenome]
MSAVSVHEAKARLSRLIQQVEAGEEVVIARGGRPVARLVPVARNRAREPGSLKDSITVADDFEAPLNEEYSTGE